MNLTAVSIRKPIAAWMVMAITVLLGCVSLARIGVGSVPDVDLPLVNISLAWPGAAAEVVEQDLVEPVEEALSAVEGIKTITSRARLGSANLTLELHLGHEVDDAIQQVQTQLGLVRSILPKDVEPAVITKINIDEFPVVWISLSGPYSRARLADTVRDVVKERLQRVPGVADIQWGGYLDRNVRLWLDRDRLDERGLTAAEVVRRIQAEHVELPAGLIEGPAKEMDVRVLGEAGNLDSMRALAVGGTADQPVRLGDVAVVENGFADERTRARNSGDPAQSLGVKKQRGSNTVQVVTAVRKALGELQAVLPEGMRLEVNYDDSIFIAATVRDVEHELAWAVALTAIVVWLFLGSWRAMLNVLLAVPMSLLGTIAAIYVLGYTLNTFTLLALALVVGLVVDDAIMVQENISRYTEAGMKTRRAALKGTLEVTFAAAASTLAVVAVFLPLGLVPGTLGQYLVQFGVTLSIAVMLSYLEAVTLAPARCAQFLTVGRQDRGLVGRSADQVFNRLRQAYSAVLPWTLRRPLLALLGALVLFIGGLALVAFLPKELMPKQDRGAMFVRVETQAGAGIEETDRAMRRVEGWLAGQPEVERYFAVIGGFGGTGVNTGVVFVTLSQKHQRSASQTEVEQRARAAFGQWPGITATIQDLGNPGSRGEIDFSLRGSDWPGLAKANEQVMQRMRDSGRFVDIDTDYQLGRPQVAVLPDRDRARDLGVSTADLANTLNILLGGAKVGKFSLDGRRVDVRARLLASDRVRPEDLARVKVRTASGDLVPLSQVVTTEERPVLDVITRKDRSRAIGITANLAPGQTQETAQAWLDREVRGSLPEGIRLVKQGAAETYQEIFTGLLLAFVAGLVIAWMILAAQFNSMIQAVTVLSILPLAIAGAAGGLLAAGMSLNFLSVLGILLLMGIVKKNSIMLVDFANAFARGRVHAPEAPSASSAREAPTASSARGPEDVIADGDTQPQANQNPIQPSWRSALPAQSSKRTTPPAEAMLSAGQVRLRPILMTSAATMAAAVPTMLGLGAGAELRQPMAFAVFWGVLVATALSLVVVPAFYVATSRHAWFRWAMLFLAALIGIAPLAGLIAGSFQALGIAVVVITAVFCLWGLAQLVQWLNRLSDR
ncbi:multidrug transporter [Planctomycetota bacterium]|nr:multidrug transporter [Planctomycetota bacterium]